MEVGTSVYLVGSSDGGVELISEITDKESLDSVRLKAAEQTPAARRTLPADPLGDLPARQARPFRYGRASGFCRGQRDRLKKL